MDLLWDDRFGYGFFPVKQRNWPYDQAYFERYRAMQESPIARALNEYRVLLSNAYAEEDLCDIGIGSGVFLDTLRRSNLCRWGAHAYGYDINAAGVVWLRQNNFGFHDPYLAPCDTLTFWDSLEHIPHPDEILANCKTVLVSIPIFSGLEAVLMSKHYRRDEHMWYFTDQGFVRYMWRLGFECIHTSNVETVLGREGIGTFVFKRAGLR